jgi:hypothetical protein
VVIDPKMLNWWMSPGIDQEAWCEHARSGAFITQEMAASVPPAHTGPMHHESWIAPVTSESEGCDQVDGWQSMEPFRAFIKEMCKIPPARPQP